MLHRLSWRLILCAAITAAYLPFLNSRLLPTAGDDKVYVQQALEMLDRGRLFVQTLFEEPNYFKGPLHYLLIQWGHALFGLQIIATRYMNWIFALIAALSLGTVIRRHVTNDEGSRLAVWTGLACIFSAGSIGHVFPSQMEMELLGLYCLAMALLDRAESPRSEFAFWVVAGLAGWAKSPLHSGLIGLSFWLYYALLALVQGDATLKKKLTSPRSWSFCLIGVAVCIAGYLPAALQDWPGFFANYLQRETLAKGGGNGGPGWQSWFPLFFYYLYPWNWMALALYASLVSRLMRKTERTAFLRDPSIRPMLLAAAILVPTVTFFWIHPYRGENYTYPAQGAVFVLLALLWIRKSRGAFLRLTQVLTAIQLLIPAGFMAWLILPHPPSWLPGHAPWTLLALSALSATVLLHGFFRRSAQEPSQVYSITALGLIPFVIAINLILYWAGDREMTDIRNHLKQDGPRASLCYLNLEKNIWNEAGMLSFALGTRVKSCHTQKLAVEHLLTGGTLIVSSAEAFQNLAQAPELKGLPLTTASWTRWGRHAHIPHGGRSALLEVRDSGNWSLVERQLLLVSRNDAARN